MALNTYSDITSYVNTIFEDSRFLAREMNLMSSLVTVFNAQGWMTRTVPIYPAMTAQKVAETDDMSNGQSFGKSTLASFTPGEAASQHLLSDRRMETDPDNAQGDAIRELSGAISTQVDTDLAGLFSSFSTGKGTAGSVAAIVNVAAAIAVLRNNTKMTGSNNVVLHPYQWHDIWLELGQPQANKAFLGEFANQAMRDYAVGNMIDGQWYTSTNVTGGGGGTCYGGVFRQEALALDVRRPYRLEPERDASKRAWELNATMGYGYGTLRSSYGVYIVSDASEPS